MRYDADHKATTRGKLLKIAASEIRTAGPDRVGVAAVMAKAGLTHGGFYAHFKSKDALVAAAIDEMAAQGRARLHRETDGRRPAVALAGYIDFYLSAAHRDNRAAGCAFAALSADLARMKPAARRHVAAASSQLTDALAALLAAHGVADPLDAARSMFAEMVGAVGLARIEPDLARSDALLAASRHSLYRRLGLERGA